VAVLLGVVEDVEERVLEDVTVKEGVPVRVWVSVPE
jgi:hypothetical protein